MFQKAGQVADATEAAKKVSGSESDKEALNQALKVARSKASLSVAARITYITCMPVAGATTRPGFSIACGILIAKVIS